MDTPITLSVENFDLVNNMNRIGMKNRTGQKTEPNSASVNLSEACEGNLVIADISGFTKFVSRMEIATGKFITSQLLASIIKSNALDLEVSEIEGDAILFYKYGERFSEREVIQQFSIIRENFHSELSSLSNALNEEIDLHVKLIAHYGTFSEYAIGRFKKLYGKTIIEAHRLLKNSIQSNAYVLMTEVLLNNKSEFYDSRLNANNRLCEKYSDLEKMCFKYVDFASPSLSPGW